MKKISLIIIMAFSLVLFNGCSEEDTLSENVFNYVTFADTNYSAVVDLGGSNTVDVVILTSNSSGSSRTFGVVVDPSSTAAAGSYDVPSTVTVPSGAQEGTLTITLSDVDLGIGVNELVIDFVGEDGLFTGSSTSVSYTQQCSEVTATLDITFDGFGSETGYSVTDALGGVVASKPAGTWADGQATASEPIVLCAGRDYTFTITDSFGDGLSFPSNGTYTVSVGGVVKVTGGGDFGDDESTDFDTN